MLEAGAPDTNTTLQLGTLPLGKTFAPLGASGVGGEFQVATQNFGARFGITPQGFLVSNFVGSVEMRPAGGPIRISLARDPVSDTLLSYAGIRDPGTNQIWGGVIANGISGTASWDTGGSGFYGQAGYKYITGDNVLTNRMLEGTTGAYWRLLARPYGKLTLGLNFSAMHYDYNLRYFTFGQGGYFSPQSYFLFNVPVHWRGQYHNRFEYSVDASLGTQHFAEDATPYFPLNPVPMVLTTPTQPATVGGSGAYIPYPRPPIPPTPVPIAVVPYYAAQTVTSINYSMTVKGGFRMTENWFMGGFLDLNNSLNYASTSAGIYVRYQQRPVTLDTPLNDADLPKWNSIRPLILP
jgi:hypothetical protein